MNRLCSFVSQQDDTMRLCRLCYVEEKDRVDKLTAAQIDTSKANLERVSGVRMSTTEGKMIFEQDFFDIIEIFENKRKEQLEKEIEAMMEERNTMKLD